MSAAIEVADIAGLRALLADEIRRRSELKPTPGPNGLLRFRCPLVAHDDTTASAMLGEYGWKCSGCGGQGSGRLMGLADALGIEVSIRQHRGYTVDDYAAEKGLPADRLESWGVVSEVGKFGSPVVYIPYYGLDGALLRRRLRLQKRPGKKNQYWEGEGGSIPGCYGLWMLPKIAPDAPVFLVEGETDTQALWCVGIMALGLPGADTWLHCREAVLPFLTDRDVYVWEEPDGGGAIMVRSIAADLPDAKVIRAAAAGAKDPCALRQQDPAGFRVRMDGLMRAAEKIGTPKPPFAFDSLVGDTLERMAEERERPLDVVPTPWAKWSEACGDEGGEAGLAHGWYVVIGGGQNGRKSMLAQNCAATAFMHGERVGFVSMEMSQGQNAGRFLPMIADVTAAELGYGERFNRATWDIAAERMAIIMEETGGVIKANRELLRSVDDVTSSILHLWEYCGCRTFVVDYLQLLWMLSHGVEKKVHEHAIAGSQSLFRLAKEHRLLIFGLSQLTNEAAKKKETPVMQDLYGGMQMAADPDQIIIPDHSRVRPVTESINLHGNGHAYPTGDVDSVAVLAKNRHGPTLEVPFRFNRRNLRITQRHVQEGEEW